MTLTHPTTTDATDAADAADTTDAADGPGPALLPFPVSVLDLGARVRETSAERGIQDVVDTAKAAERYGYHRFWVAEHHSSLKTASGFPAVMIAHIAAQTTHIRVGSGGVMLPNYAPFAVAEQFATLQALYPGRIDLGLGRSPGGTGVTTTLLEAALRREPGAGARFPEQIDELLGFLRHRGSDPDRHGLPALPLTPHTAAAPEVVVLGASENSARMAADRGLPFAYGHHQGSSKCRPSAARTYRTAFAPGPEDGRPYFIVAVNVVCAETDQEAEDLALETSAYFVRHPEGGGPAGPHSPARQDYLARQALAENQVVRGTPQTVAAGLRRLRDTLEADEVMVVPYELDGATRCRTLRLLSSVRGALPGAATSVAGAARRSSAP